jgi:Smg protein
MKDNLFELLLNLFEKSLTQIQKSHYSADAEPTEYYDDELTSDDLAIHIKSAAEESTRVFTYEEQMKLTKASYQFLMKIKLWGLLDNDHFEQVMNQLDSSDSRVITLQETKWTIRNVLANTFDEEQLAFLDLVLYQTEDKLTLH